MGSNVDNIVHQCLQQTMITDFSLFSCNNHRHDTKYQVGSEDGQLVLCSKTPRSWVSRCTGCLAARPRYVVRIMVSLQPLYATKFVRSISVARDVDLSSVSMSPRRMEPSPKA